MSLEGHRPSPNPQEPQRGNETEQQTRRVGLDQPFHPFAAGFVRETSDWEGNRLYEAPVTLDVAQHSLLKDVPALPFHFLLLEGERAKQHQSGPRAANALTPLGTQGYHVTAEDYDPAQRVRKFREWQKQGTISYDQAALWLRVITPYNEPVLGQVPTAQEEQLQETFRRLALSAQLRQLELTLDFGTGEPLAARLDLTAYHARGIVEMTDFYPKHTGPLSVPAEHDEHMRPMTPGIPESWLTEGLGVYLPNDTGAYERAQMTFSVVPEKQKDTPR